MIIFVNFVLVFIVMLEVDLIYDVVVVVLNIEFIIVVKELENNVFLVFGNLLFFINFVCVVIVINVLVVLKKLMNKNVKIIIRN